MIASSIFLKAAVSDQVRVPLQVLRAVSLATKTPALRVRHLVGPARARPVASQRPIAHLFSPPPSSLSRTALR